MAIKRTGEVSGNKDSEQIPNLDAGEHEGRLRYVADLGMHTNDYKGEVKPDVQKLSLGIEIVGETVEVDGEVKPRVMWSQPFNIFFSLTGKGKELELYKVFSPSAVEGGVADWDSVIDEPCNVTVIHKQGKGENKDNVYDNIESISPIPGKYKSGVDEGLVTDGCTGDVEDPENPAQANARGLASWSIANRIIAGEVDTTLTQEAALAEVGFDDAIPF